MAADDIDSKIEEWIHAVGLCVIDKVAIIHQIMSSGIIILHFKQQSDNNI